MILLLHPSPNSNRTSISPYQSYMNPTQQALSAVSTPHWCSKIHRRLPHTLAERNGNPYTIRVGFPFQINLLKHARSCESLQLHLKLRLHVNPTRPQRKHLEEWILGAHFHSHVPIDEHDLENLVLLKPTHFVQLDHDVYGQVLWIPHLRNLSTIAVHILYKNLLFPPQSPRFSLNHPPSSSVPPPSLFLVPTRELKRKGVKAYQCKGMEATEETNAAMCGCRWDATNDNQRRRNVWPQPDEGRMVKGMKQNLNLKNKKYAFYEIYT